MKTCPACGGRSPADAEHCAHCPASFPRAAAPAASAPGRGAGTAVPPWAFGLAALAFGLFLYTARPKAAATGVHDADAAFDPTRDAERDLADAIARAKVTRRRVLVDVGGNWCLWCRRMDAFFAAHPDVAGLRDKNYVLVRVSVTPERPNAAALSRFPTPAGYPHLYVLDAGGELVTSKDTSELEQGDGYDPVRFAGFLSSFAPPS